MDMARKQKEPEQPILLDELVVSYRERVLKMDSGKVKTFAIGGIALSVVLIVLSSVLYYMNFLGSWVPALVGSPAGVILFLIGLGSVYRTRIGEWGIWDFRTKFSYTQRVRRVLIWFVVYAVVFIPFGSFIPYGLGGAILICLALTAVVAARRSPEEYNLAVQGLPDPRDVAAAEAADDYAEEPVVADTTEDNGTVGGKLN